MEDTLSTSSINDLNSLFSAVNTIEREGRTFTDAIRIVFLRNITVEGLETFLKYYLYKSGIRPEIAFGGYGTMIQDVLADDGLVKKTGPDIIVVSLALDELDPAYGTPGWRGTEAQTA